MRYILNAARVAAFLLIAASASSVMASADPACPAASDPPRPKGSVRHSQQLPPSIELHCGSQSVNQTQYRPDERSSREKEPLWGFQLLEGITKLLASIVWPIFGLIVVFTFRRQVADLISRIKSIEFGKNKVILDTKFAPAPSTLQSAKSSQDAEEAAEAEQTSRSPLPPLVRRNALLAEDLALRALQDEYGATIRRQVTAGADQGFDGAFVSDDRLYIVEVKYYRSTFLPDKLRVSISRLSEAITRYGWTNVQIILAAVFEDLDDAYSKTLKLSKAVSSSNVPVIVRTFSMAELRARFDLPPNGDN